MLGRKAKQIPDKEGYGTTPGVYVGPDSVRRCVLHNVPADVKVRIIEPDGSVSKTKVSIQDTQNALVAYNMTKKAVEIMEAAGWPSIRSGQQLTDTDVVIQALTEIIKIVADIRSSQAAGIWLEAMRESGVQNATTIRS